MSQNSKTDHSDKGLGVNPPADAPAPNVDPSEGSVDAPQRGGGGSGGGEERGGSGTHGGHGGHGPGTGGSGRGEGGGGGQSQQKAGSPNPVQHSE